MKKYLIAALFLVLTVTHGEPAVAFDPRATQMRVVLEKYDSPMAGMEDLLIATAEKYNLDWTLLAAIAGTESAFAKRMPCANPFGWGITGTKRLCFESLEQAIVKVGEGIGTKYNTTSVETIGRKYNTVSTAGWVAHTRFFMNKIKTASVPVSELPITL